MNDAGGAGDAAVLPQVSVIIAAWSAERTIERAALSALEQSVPVEVIVIDDASPDATAQIVADLAAADPRITLLRQGENQGPSAARNRGLDAARAPWLTVLDADDFFCAQDRFARLLAVAEAEGADFVADNLWKVPEDDPDGPRLPMISGGPIGVQRLDAAGFVAANLSARHGGRRELGFLKPLMSKAFLEKNRLSYDPGIRLGEDYVLYAQAIISGAHFVLTDTAGYVAVTRPDSLSGWHPTEAHEHLVRADTALLARRDLDRATRRALRAHLIEQRKKWAWRRLIDAKVATDPVAAAACFWAPPAVIADLLMRLSQEARSRLGAR